MGFQGTLPRCHPSIVWQVAGDPDASTDPRPSYGIVSFEVLSDGPVLLAVTNRWGGGGNSGGGWIPELTTEQEFLDDGWVELTGPLAIYNNDIEAVSDTYFTVYRRESSAGESFTYRTEKYHPPHLLVSPVTTPISVETEVEDPIKLDTNSIVVSVLSTEIFDVQTLDVASIRLADPSLIEEGGVPIAPKIDRFRDLTNDGLLDLQMKFSIPGMIDAGVLGPLSEELLLTGLTIDGANVLGSDAIEIFSPSTLAVPEPSSGAIMAFFLTVFVLCRRARLGG